MHEELVQKIQLEEHLHKAQGTSTYISTGARTRNHASVFLARRRLCFLPRVWTLDTGRLEMSLGR